MISWKLKTTDVKSAKSTIISFGRPFLGNIGYQPTKAELMKRWESWDEPVKHWTLDTENCFLVFCENDDKALPIDAFRLKRMEQGLQ